MTDPLTAPSDGPTPLDDLVGYVDAYNQARAEVTRWTALADQARRVLESALGDTQVGTIAGQPRIRWTTVTTSRLDTKLVKDKAPDVYALCQTVTTSRRFTVVEPT